MVITGFWRLPYVVVAAVSASWRSLGGSGLGVLLAHSPFAAAISASAPAHSFLGPLGRLLLTFWWLFVAQVYLWFHSVALDYRFWLFVVAASISAGLYLWLVGMRVYEARSWH